MKSTVLTFALTCTPALLAAQASAGVGASATAHTTVSVPASFSAESKANIEASVRRARAANVPVEAMRQRIAEGQAKGASDAQVATAVQHTEARLEASQHAMIAAGRQHPTTAEVTAGEQAMAGGATEAQLEALVKHAPPDRPLTVALNVVARLEAEGRPAANALATVEAKLASNATDATLVSLTGNAGLSVGAGQGSASGTTTGSATSGAATNGTATNGAAANAAAGMGAAAGAAVKGTTGATAGVTGAVSGAVSGALGPKKP